MLNSRFMFISTDGCFTRRWWGPREASSGVGVRLAHGARWAWPKS